MSFFDRIVDSLVQNQLERKYAFSRKNPHFV